MIPEMLQTIQTSFLSAQGDSLGLFLDLGKVSTPLSNFFLSNKLFLRRALRSYEAGVSHDL